MKFTSSTTNAYYASFCPGDAMGRNRGSRSRAVHAHTSALPADVHVLCVVLRRLRAGSSIALAQESLSCRPCPCSLMNVLFLAKASLPVVRRSHDGKLRLSDDPV
jgi:hypothetical protein